MSEQKASYVAAEEQLQLRYKAIDELGGDLDAKNSALAQNILHEDLGYFGEHHKNYSLSEETRDVLAAHTRQDAALAVLNSTNTRWLGVRILRAVRLLTAVVIVCTAAVIWVLWTN